MPGEDGGGTSNGRGVGQLFFIIGSVDEAPPTGGESIG